MTMMDLSGQFFLKSGDLGKPRVATCLARPKTLNSYMTVTSYENKLPDTEEDLMKDGFDKFTVVILTEVTYEEAFRINHFCRKRGINFI